MSTGLPCVVTDVGDSAFAVGDTGLVVPPREPAKLADAICQLLNLSAEDRANLGQKARQRVIDHFSMEKMVSSYEKMFVELARK